MNSRPPPPHPGAPELKINYLNERKLEKLLSGDLDAQWSQLERLLRSHSLCMLILLLLCFWIRSPFYNSRVQLDFKTAPRAKRVRLYGREWSRSGFVEGRDKGATQLLNGGDRISEGSRELMIGFYCFSLAHLGLWQEESYRSVLWRSRMSNTENSRQTKWWKKKKSFTINCTDGVQMHDFFYTQGSAEPARHSSTLICCTLKLQNTLVSGNSRPSFCCQGRRCILRLWRSSALFLSGGKTGILLFLWEFFQTIRHSLLETLILAVAWSGSPTALGLLLDVRRDRESPLQTAGCILSLWAETQDGFWV